MNNASNNEKMMQYLSHRLKDEQGIDWDSYEYHMTCLNHVINLAIDDFMKIIKEYMKKIKDYLRIINDDDDDNDNDDNDDDNDNDDDKSDDSILVKMRIE